MSNPIKILSVRERWIWIGSMAIVAASNALTETIDPLTLVTALIGVTSLIFAARGHVLSQILMVLFSFLYAVISFRFRYWGEMVTYLGMTMPMAAWSLITWYRNPSAENKAEVAIRRLRPIHIVFLLLSCMAVTAAFYLLLARLQTPNILFSVLSIATSFLAAALTMLRSSYFGLGYAANDLVLIVMWILASSEDPAYIPVVVNFVVFFFNDMYGFFSWKKRERNQTGRGDHPAGRH